MPSVSPLKSRVFTIIQPDDSGNVASRVFDAFIMTLVLASIVCVYVSTFDISQAAQEKISVFETGVVTVFTVEFLLRVWTADLLHPGIPRWRAVGRYLWSWDAFIDLLAIAPFYLPMILPVDLLALRGVRLLRVLRLFKLRRYSSALASMCAVVREKAGEIAVSLFSVLILLVIASLLIYHAEHEAQPDKFQNAFSGLWWAVATLTTVGYGDIYPVTALGKIIGALIAVLGIGMVAIPTGILSSGFMEHLTRKNSAAPAPSAPAAEDDRSAPLTAPLDAPRAAPDTADTGKPARRFCPHCGRELD